VPRYLVSYPRGQQRDDMLIEDDLTLTFNGDWAILGDPNGPALAIPAALGVLIERVDEHHEPAEPAPQKE
jgi:hypothetical protein